MQKQISTAHMRQKTDEYYKSAVMKARKSEKALRQVQRQAYPEMITCATKTYDQYKECVGANMGLFELDPLKYEQIEATTERLATSKELCDQLKIENHCSTKFSKSAKSVVSIEGGKSCRVSIASSLPYTQNETDVQERKATETFHTNMYVTSDKGTNRKIRLNASVPKSDTVKPIKQRGSQKCLTSFNGVKQPNSCSAIATSHGSLQKVRKRKREIDDLKSKQIMDLASIQTVSKKIKLDIVQVNSNVSKTVTQLSSCIPIVSKKRKRDTLKNVGLKATSNAQVPCKRSKLNSNIDKSLTVDNKSEKKDHILMQTNKEPRENKWIECKVNHPIKQSKSKIPLPIHKLGCKNDSNLAAHSKRIGAYKRIKLTESYSSRLLNSKIIDEIK